MDIINKFSDSAKGIARNAKFSLKAGSIKHQINELEYALGHLIQKKRNELPDEFFKLIEATQILAQIDELTEQLDMLNEQKNVPRTDTSDMERDNHSAESCAEDPKVCAACQTEIKDDWTFCPSCGEKVISNDEPTTRICSSCNKELSADYTFCPFCGNRT